MLIRLCLFKMRQVREAVRSVAGRDKAHARESMPFPGRGEHLPRKAFLLYSSSSRTMELQHVSIR